MTRAGLLAGLWLGWVAACSDPPAEPAATPAPAAPAALPVAPAGGRLVVAEVNGAPVYEDCVVAQAAAHALDRRAARDECIAFELLAQEAERRGLAADPEVRRAQKNESVRRLIDEAFVARYPGPDSVPRAELEAVYGELRLRYVRPEYRETVYVRLPVPEKEHPPGSPADAEARALMERAHAALAGRRDLTKDDVLEAVTAVAGDRKVEQADIRPIHRRDAIVPPYLDATFAIPEPGVVSPPFRTEWGWDIVLLTKIHPAVNQSVDDVKDELFELARRRLYQQWVASLVGKARIEVHEDTLLRLQQAEERARFADLPAPEAPAGPPGGARTGGSR